MSVPEFLMLLDGALVPALSGDWLESVEPATGQILGRVPASGEKDVERAVTAAESAFADWRQEPPRVRADALRAFATLLRSHEDELAVLEARDTGNTIGICRADVHTAAAQIEYYAGLAYEIKGETVPASAPGMLHLSTREPYGAVGRILPFNHPLMFAAAKLAAPLVAGNTLIIKPSEQSPLSTAALGPLLAEAFPAGVVNVVTGLGGTAGDALVRDPRVRRLAFIGSVPTGLAIQRTAAEVCVKHVTLELGGKNPMIVFPDVDVNAVADAAVAGMNFAWQGQSCGSTTRLFLHEDIYDEVVEMLRERVSALTVGDPLNPASSMGPINSRAQYEKDLAHIAAAREDGARLLVGGGRPEGKQFAEGFWLQPTVFCDVTPDMRLFSQEVFGPVLSVIRWSDRKRVVQMANSVEYGLTAAIWTRDLDAAISTAREVQAGYTWINAVASHYPGTSFGGVKNSGLGREEGLEELLSYTESAALNISVGR